MKVLRWIMVVILLMTGSTGCSAGKHVLLSDSCSSALFSAQEMEQARQAIEKQYCSDPEIVGDMTIVYSGDARSMDPEILDWMNELNDSKALVAAHMEFSGTFKTGLKTQSLNPDSEYAYSWHVARTEKGPWKLMTCGMG